jgi:hypothetical protein
MLRLASVVVLCALLAGCGGGGGNTTHSAPEAAAPVHRGGQEQRSAQQVAAYRTAVNDALASYAAAQRSAFRGLRRSDDAAAFVAALRRLRRATLRAADRLRHARPPATVAAPHGRLIGAFRALAAILGAAIDARDQGDFARLRRIGRRLQSGEFSRPIESAAGDIDAALR